MKTINLFTLTALLATTSLVSAYAADAANEPGTMTNATTSEMSPATNATETTTTAETATTAPAATVKYSAMTQKFVTKASESGSFEIQTSQLALQKSSNDSVKQFAQQMIDDHTAASDKLKSILTAEGNAAMISDKLDPDQTKKLAKLQKLSGKKFDKEYVSMQKDAHKEAVDLFAHYSKNGDDSQLKSFAGSTLPVLKQHQDHAKSLKV